MNPFHPITFFVQGDSWGAFNMQPGSTISPINVTPDQDFVALYALLTGHTFVVQFLDAAEGMAFAFDSLHGGWYVDSAHQSTGQKGFTEAGLIVDALADRIDVSPHHFRFHAQGGSTAGAYTSNAPPWCEGVPDDPADAPTSINGFWHRPPMDDPAGDPLYIGHSNPPTERTTSLWTIGGGNALFSDGAIYFDEWDQTAIDAVIAIEADGLNRGLDYEFGRAELGNRIHEAFLCTYTHLGFDDLRLGTPPNLTDYVFTVDQLTGPAHPHFDGADQHPQYVAPNYNPFTLPGVPFPPPNQGTPGFFKFAAAAGTGPMSRQWVKDGVASYRDWYRVWYADTFFNNFHISLFGGLIQSQPADDWQNANTWAINNGYAGVGLGAAFSVEASFAKAVTYGTRNYASDTINSRFRYICEQVYGQVAETQRAKGRAVHVVPLWDAIPWADGTGPNYPCPDTSWFVDGIHPHAPGARLWVDAILDYVLEHSIHRRRYIPAAGHRRHLTAYGEPSEAE